MLVYICCYYCCSLYHKNILLSYFAFVAAVAALEFKVSVSSKLLTSNNVVIMFIYVVKSNVTDDLEHVLRCDSRSIICNVSLSLGMSVSHSVCRLSTKRYAVGSVQMLLLLL